MVIMITRARVSGCFNSVLVASTLFVVAGSAVATAIGTALSLLGVALGPAADGIVCIAALVGLGYFALSRTTPWQFDRETPIAWLHHEDSRTALYNGAALGSGFSTRIGFWLWYILPIAALLSGRIVLGATVFFVYGISRVFFSLIAAHASFHSEPVIVRLLRLETSVRMILDVVFFIAVGYLSAAAIGNLA